MAEKMSVEQLKEVVDLGVSVVKLGMDVAKDKKVDMGDLGLLLSAMPKLVGEGVAALQGIESVPGELEDLSAEESAMLVAHVMGKLSLDEPKAKAVAEKALNVVGSVYGLVKELVA